MTKRFRSIRYSVLLLLVAPLGLILIGTPPAVTSQASDDYWFDLELVAEGLDQPVYVTDAGDGSERLFVVEKPGVIQVVDGGTVLPEPFLDISSNVQSGGAEQGLLGLAFHPNYAENGYFYLTYSPSVTEWRLERYTVSDDPNRADEESATTILSVDHPGDTHYGGMVTFGPDGYLWTSLGDGGGGAYDPFANAQDPSTLLGAILRIDVDSKFPYAIPPDNPFVDEPEHRPEIWSYGLRNPWRFSFDRLTGDIYIGDVGQDSREELNFEPADSEGGRNYGWPHLEGSACTPISPDCDPGQFVPPVFDYGRDLGCAVTGGYVYREDPTSQLYGTYVFADFCNGSIWTAERDDNDGWSAGIRLFTTMNISSFGEDSQGRLYITDLSGGAIYRVRASEQAPAPVLVRPEPAMIPAGGVACVLHLRGWNFMETAVGLIDGEPRTTTYRNSSWLTVQLTSDDLQSPRVLNLSVSNGEGSGLASSSVNLDIFDAGTGFRALYDRWSRTDGPVQSGTVSRTWMWGPAGMTCPVLEPYLDAAGGMRVVQYFDKSRMEINDPGGNPSDPWYVTNGLLAKELISGQRQVGDETFEPLAPSQANVAGDPGDTGGPTYASFSGLLDPVADRGGESVIERLGRDGTVTVDPDLGNRGVVYGFYDDVTGHNIPVPFWNFMNSSGLVVQDGQLVTDALFPNAFFATGRPVTEAYWTTVEVSGESAEVMVQCFERRCLTYTPTNPAGWQVEAGNVGQHYYQWVIDSR